MTTDKEKKLWASLFMVLLIASPYTVLSDDSFCTGSWTYITFNDYVAYAGTYTGSVYSWGVNQFGGLGYGNPGQIQSTPVEIFPNGPAITYVIWNLQYALGIAVNGSVYGWGTNNIGGLGPGIPLGTVQLTPVKINALGTITDLSAHNLVQTTYAIKTTGTLWAMGDNSHAQLGKTTANLASSATPVKIGNDNDWFWTFPSSRDAHICAIKTNSSLYCWGENYYGQVGDGTNVDRAIPMRIGSASDTWQTFAPLLYATIALHSNGTLFGWGTTFYGVFGDGKNYSTYKVPTQIAGGMTFSEIAVHDNYIIAIGTNGKLYGWGENRYTQVNSDPSVGIQNTPHQITSGSNWVAVAVSLGIQMNAIGSAFALKANGNLFAWGSNDMGQLGLGIPNTTVPIPTRVTGVGSNIQFLWSAGYNTGIVDNDGELYMTGFNNFNLLGDGTVLPSDTFHSCADRSQKCVSHVCQNRRLRF